MPGRSTDQLLNSLKGRIWLAVSALAVLNCVFGLGAYLAVTLFLSDPFFTIFVAFFVAAFATLVFGWWLSSEVIRPIETVSMVAQTLERSPSASIPKTTGSSETDELLRSLHRLSQQVQNVITLMDDVVAGKTSAATAPLQNADKLSISFQRLVAKVTESVDAKQQLDTLSASLNKLNGDIAAIRGGNLDVEPRSDTAQTKEIADGVRHIMNRLAELVRQVQIHSMDTERAVRGARKAMKAAIEDREKQISRISASSGPSMESPHYLQSVGGELNSTLSAVKAMVAAKPAEAAVPIDDATRANRLRSLIAESVKKIQRLRDKSHGIPQLSRSAAELSRRSNLVALNTSIQGTSPKPIVSASRLLSDEMKFVSERSEGLSNEIASINEILLAEISELETAFSSMSSEMAELQKSVTRNVENEADFGEHLKRLAGLKAKIENYSAEQFAEHQRLLGYLATISDSGDEMTSMIESEQSIQKISTLVEQLRDSVSDFKISGISAPVISSYQPPATDELPAPPEPPAVEPLDLLGDS